MQLRVALLAGSESPMVKVLSPAEERVDVEELGDVSLLSYVDFNKREAAALKDGDAWATVRTGTRAVSDSGPTRRAS